MSAINPAFHALPGHVEAAPGVVLDNSRAHAGPVSWSAIFAGAAAAAALSLILLILGTGLGLSSVSPWANDGISATTFGVSTILWVTFTQIAAAGMGGYLAGRLRTKWVAVHTDEVYFRDTAHGFLAWAIASLATAALLTSVIGSIVGAGVQAGAAVGAGVVNAAATTGAAKSDIGANPMGYFVDALFRKDRTAAAASMPVGTPAAGVAFAESASDPSPAIAPEVARIYATSLRTGALPADDVRYVGQLVAQRTGLSQPDAEKRVTDSFNRVQSMVRESEIAAKNAADKARKASAYSALWLFISLLIGAFVASLAATIGGRRRDA